MDIRNSVRHPSEGRGFDFKGAIPFPGDEAVTHSAFVAEQTTEPIKQQCGIRPFLCVVVLIGNRSNQRYNGRIYSLAPAGLSNPVARRPNRATDVVSSRDLAYT